MRIVIENLPHDISEQEIREGLSPFAPAEKINLIKEGSMPAALIEMDMTRAQAEALALRIEGHVHKGHRLRAWVPLFSESQGWADKFEELDREIARMALLCKVSILDPGVIRRVLQKDDSVCGTNNPAAFAKLHDLLMVHLAAHERSVDALGQAQTAAIEDHVIRRLRQAFPDLAGNWPPA